MPRDFQRVAVVNRGEPAMRFLHAAEEMRRGLPAGAPGRLHTIALYTEPDRRALFVREADEAYELGAATFVDPKDGQSKSRYLDYAGLEKALLATRAEAVWVGWGFVAEHAEFADLCHQLGVVFIGPSGDVMRSLGDKIASKLLAEEAEVPVSPWSGGALASLEEARQHATRLGYPLMLKAAAGGGGRGIRKIRSEAELAEVFDSARSEALKAFGDPTVFLERLVEGARHVEVQIVADEHGTVWAAGVRDCTLQRRNQKVLEESPSPVLTEEEDRGLRAASARLARRAGYVNAGTVEYLFDPRRREFYFMEVNTRLQVEHPVTEMITGLDLVKLQVHIARGGELPPEPPAPNGHAIEVRLNAEDPDHGFAPAAGTLDLLRLPTGPGVRVDTGVEEGDAVAPEFDSMIAKIIAYGADRSEALSRLSRALAGTSVVISGGASNKAFLQELVRRPEVAASEVDIGWLERWVATGEHLSLAGAEVALIQAALEAYEAELALEKTRFYASARRGRPEVDDAIGRRVELRHQGNGYVLEVKRLGIRDYQVETDGGRIGVTVEPLGRARVRLRVGGRGWRVSSVARGLDHLVEVDGVPHRISREQAGMVRAPSPAVVVSIPVQEGDEVAAGDRLVVLEAMKMETSLTAEFAGRVREILVRSNVQVAAGTPLLRLEPTGQEEEAAGGRRLSFEGLAVPEVEASGETCEPRLQDLARAMLGWDVDPAELHRLVAEQGDLCRERRADDPAIVADEDRILSAFVDVCALFRRQPDDAEGEEGARLSTQEYLFTYLRDLEVGTEKLPASFRQKLERAVAHYGLDDLEPGSELGEDLFRIAKSYRRMARQVAPVLAILERRLEHVEELRPHLGEGFRELLERLVGETRDRYPAVHDLAREVAYRYFDQPLLEETRRRIYREVEETLEHLDQRREPEDRDERVGVLVDCPQPLHALLSRRFDGAKSALEQAMLETMLRRYYRIRELENVELLSVRSRSLVRAEVAHEGRRSTLLATHARLSHLGRAARAVGQVLSETADRGSVVVELYLRHDGPVEADEAAEEIAQVLDGRSFPSGVGRVVVTLAGQGAGAGASAPGSGLQIFNFEPRDAGEEGGEEGSEENGEAAGYREQRLFRGLHPLMAERLQLWRLERFHIERLPSAEDIYFFHGKARDNPADERLFAISEVRALTPIRDEAGRIVQLPQFERVYHEALAGIRRFQSQRPPERRLHWNRVVIYVQPALEIRPEELRGLVVRLAPATEGLGLQKVVVRGRIVDPQRERLHDVVLEISSSGRRGLSLRYRKPTQHPIETLSEVARKVVRLRARGLVYPYEVIKMLAPPRDRGPGDLPPGRFTEYDLDGDGRLVPVDRPYGGNQANIVVGVVESFTAKVPEGLKRVILLGDPSRGMGSLAEPECRRILEALDLAEELEVPLEWFAVSAGAKISMESGTENMDWIARVLRRLITFTQSGGEVNLVVYGVNVGAQPYWNAEATMLMHTRGVLIQTAQGSMVLTGKRALDYSGGVSAEDDQGIGGYERIMGPNGQAQYFARDISEACHLLLRYYDHAYVVPGERFPRPATTTDPSDRDVCGFAHGTEIETVGEVFSGTSNPARKRPFDVRRVMRSVTDQDHEPLERWFGMRDAEVAVVWDAHLGGQPITLLGIESRPVPRLGFVPADGPDQWTSGTLFPLASKKMARAINAASGNRPLVVLANLSGFDGSPESMRQWQLEFGAEIGRAVVNFEGPIVFCVISRYHGGAFVVFSNALHDNMEVAALEGSYASVIGGAPAAAVVFARDVQQRTRDDERIRALETQIAEAGPGERAKLSARMNELYDEVYSEKLGEVAEEFDGVHNIYRALRVGSVHRIIQPAELRPYLIGAVERGMDKELERWRSERPPRA